MAGYSSLQKSNTVTIVRDLTASISASFTASFSVDLMRQISLPFYNSNLSRLLACSYAFMKVTELV